jgi:HAE1 family hydrophobic/amphiphilic exporter-1
MDFALVDVEKAVGPIRSDPDVDEVLVRHFDPRQAAVLGVGLVATEDGPDLAELRRIARRQVATALERLPGVAEVRVTGGRDKQVQVVVDRLKLDSYGLTLAELESRLAAANVDVNAGTLEEGGRVYLVRGLARYRRPEDVAAVVVRFGQDAEGRRTPIRVRDVAEVRLGDAEITHLVRVDGREGVGLAIYKEAGANTVEVSRTVRDALESLSGDLPGIEVRVVSDEAALVEDAISDVEDAALVGVALAMLVLVLFLRSPGPTVIVAVTVPVSLLATLFLMHLSGQTLNVMTLAGLSLGAGMLVDNSIVVVESIFRKQAEGLPPEEAAAVGTAEVGAAVISGTLTTCAVFLPIVFVRGLAARLITGLSFSVVVSLLVSLFAALLLIPALCGWLLPRKPVRPTDPGGALVERLVHRVLGRPVTAVAIAAALVVLSAFALRDLGSELLPPADPRQFSVRLVGPAGQRVEATERAVETVEQILREAAGDDLVAILSEVGRLPEDDRFIREEQTEENTARVLVRLAAGGRGGGHIVAAAAPAVESLEDTSVSWEIAGSAISSALGTAGPPVVIELAGQSLEELREGAEIVRTAFAGRPELWNVHSSFEGGPPELRVMLDRTLADGMGVDMQLVAQTLEASLDGRRTTALQSGDEERDVVLLLPRVRRDELLDVPLVTSSGVRVSLGDVAAIEPQAGAREIFRRDQRRVARVTANVADDVEYPAAMLAVDSAIADAVLPPGVALRVTGEEEERVRTFAELRFAAALSILLVFMVLAGTFESLLHPITVAAAIPLSLVGVAAVLWPVGRPIDVMALLGGIVLAGVAVNDAILLVDSARQQMSEHGMSARDALARAARIRLRPLLMTLSTTVLAMLPLALGASESARLRSPLALTLIGGLIASMLSSLLVIPPLYLLFERLKTSVLRRGRAA